MIPQAQLPPSPASPMTPVSGGPGSLPVTPAGDTRTMRDYLDRIVSLVLRMSNFRWQAAIVMLLGCLAALAVAMLRPRLYTSETLIVYREGIGARTVTGIEQSAEAQQKLALKLKEMLLSRTTLHRLVDEFHLYPDLVEEKGYVEAVDAMRKQINVRMKDGETFGISFTGADPGRVQKVTERLAQELLNEHSKSRLSQAGQTREFIDAEKRRSDEDLRVKEGELAQFIAKHPEFIKSADGLGPGTGPGAAFRAMSGAKSAARPADPQLAALEREAARIQARLGMPVVRRDRDGEPRTAAGREADNELKQAQKDLAEKLAQFTEEHPDVRAAKGRVKAAEAKLRRAEAISEAPKPDPGEEGTIDRAALEAELRRVNDEIGAYKRRKAAEGGGAASSAASAANAIVALETEWTRLNRDVADARERNQQLETRQFRASIMENAIASQRDSEMIIVDPAYKPTRPDKGRTQIVLAGFAASLVVALMVAMMMVLLDDRLYDRVDVEVLNVAGLLGVVPRDDGKRDNRG